MENMTEQGPMVIFRTKADAEDYLSYLRKFVYKFDILTVADVLNMDKKQSKWDDNHVGYSRKTVKALKPVKDGRKWIVQFPKAGKMKQRPDGYWEVEDPEKEENGG